MNRRFFYLLRRLKEIVLEHQANITYKMVFTEVVDIARAAWFSIKKHIANNGKRQEEENQEENEVNMTDGDNEDDVIEMDED